MRGKCGRYFGGFSWPGFFTLVVSYAPLLGIVLKSEIMLLKGRETSKLSWSMLNCGEPGTRLTSLYSYIVLLV